MATDYHRLVAGLAGVTDLPAAGGELVAVRTLLETTREAVGASAGTFTEYRPPGGRVVVAVGGMAWALGQPVPAEFLLDADVRRAFHAWVEAMPLGAAEPLMARGIIAVAGAPVRSGGDVVGALHLFFTEFGEANWEPVTDALAVAAAFAERVYTGRDASPILSVGEEDDRSLFLAVTGHELRTPVTVIKGYSSLLADRWDSLAEDQRLAAVRVLTQRADELARLVDRLLGVSAGDAVTGGLVRRVPFDPADVLVRAAGGLPDELRRTVRVELPNWLPPAAGDPDVMGTIVTELVTNAVRAGRGRDSIVDITAGADADTVFIRVLDRGYGIDPAQAERAFERFWRAPAPRDAEGQREGVGLGLYLVRRLVERQNGWVSLRPRDGGGTIAEVRLARADGPHRTGEA